MYYLMLSLEIGGLGLVQRFKNIIKDSKKKNKIQVIFLLFYCLMHIGFLNPILLSHSLKRTAPSPRHFIFI